MTITVCEMWGFHSGENLDCNQVLYLQMEAISSSKILVTTYKTTLHHNTKDHNKKKDIIIFINQSTNVIVPMS
jgi:hypothetical protein